MKTLLHVSLLLLGIQPTSSGSCNIFPKVFGGTVGDTVLLQIDVYGDYLATAGFTNDSGLTGYAIANFVPYVAMM